MVKNLSVMWWRGGSGNPRFNPWAEGSWERVFNAFLSFFLGNCGLTGTF